MSDHDGIEPGDELTSEEVIEAADPVRRGDAERRPGPVPARAGRARLRRPAPHDDPRVPDGRPRRAHHRPQPVQGLPGDLPGHRPRLVLPRRELLGPRPVRHVAHVVPVGHVVGRRAEPPADAAADDADHPHGPRRRVRLPLRPLQHRRPGPVPRRLVLRDLDRHVVRAHEAVLPRAADDRDRNARRRRLRRASPASSRRPSVRTR